MSGLDVNKRRRQSVYFAGFTSGLGGWFLIFGQSGCLRTRWSGAEDCCYRRSDLWRLDLLRTPQVCGLRSNAFRPAFCSRLVRRHSELLQSLLRRHDLAWQPLIEFDRLQPWLNRSFEGSDSKCLSTRAL